MLKGLLTLVLGGLLRGAWALKIQLQAVLTQSNSSAAGAAHGGLMGAAAARGTTTAVFACVCLWVARKLWRMWACTSKGEQAQDQRNEQALQAGAAAV